MNSIEKNRISHRQLYRQIILTFTAPFLLCLLGRGKIQGKEGLAGTAAAVLLLCFYVIVLVRLSSCYEDLEKYVGRLAKWFTGIFFLLYLILTGAFLLRVAGEIVPVSLLEGVSPKWIMLAAVLVCSFGTQKGMQRRGRMAEVSGALLLGCILLLLFLSLGQAKADYFREIPDMTWNIREILKKTYGIWCAFSGLGLLPFMLCLVEKPGSAAKPVILGILTIGGILLGVLLLLPAVFGWARLQREAYPILPLLAGADLPGNVLARFDVLWMGFLIYGLLFSLGSIFHYGSQVFEMTIGKTSPALPVLLAAFVYGLAILHTDRYDILKLYDSYLTRIYVPALLAIQMFFSLSFGKKAHLAVRSLCFILVISCVLFFSGCGGIDPEKRLYPLAVGLEEKSGAFQMSYGIPDLSQTTGQEKTEENTSSFLEFSGESFEEIEELYDQSQEKYRDLGHLQVLVLGKELLNSEKIRTAMNYLKKEPFIGENVYVFQTDLPSEIIQWKSANGTTVGEYLTGIMENRLDGQQSRGVTLREVYHTYYKKGVLPVLPEIVLQDDLLLVNESLDQQTARTETFTPALGWWGTLYPQFCFGGTSDRIKNREHPRKISFWLAKALDW